MYQYDDPTAVATLPAPAAPGTPGFFTDGNAALQEPATELRSDFMNMLMMELLNVLVAGGITPSKVKYNQVTLAIEAMLAALRAELEAEIAAVQTSIPVNGLVAMPSSLPSLVNYGSIAFLRSGSLQPAANYPLARVTATLAPTLLSAIQLTQVVYFNSVYLGANSLNSSAGGLFSSSDLRNWTQQAGTIGLCSVATSPSVAVALPVTPSLTSGATNSSAWYSSDGKTWSSASLPATDNACSWSAIANANGLFVATQSNTFYINTDHPTSAYATSPDGKTWTSANLPTTHNFWTVAAANGIFVAVGAQHTTGAVGVFTSTDGEMWTPRVSAIPTAMGPTVLSADYVGSLFYVIIGTSVMTSPDGTVWTAQPNSPFTGEGSIAYSAAAALYFYGNTSYSVDGVTWQSQPILPAIPATSTWYVNSTLVCNIQSSLYSFAYNASGYVGLPYVVTPPPTGQAITGQSYADGFAYYARIA